MKRAEKVSDRVLRHVPKLSHVLLAEVPLEFCEIPAVGIDGVAGKPAFDAHMIEIALDQCVGIHFER